MKTLHDINGIRMEFIKKYHKLKLSKVLDVGCGGGILSESLAAEEAKVIGIDLSNQLIKVAKDHAVLSGLNINYHAKSIENFSTEDVSKFDLITSMELLEHVDNPDLMIKTISALLKTNGLFIGSTITRSIKSFFLGIVFAENIAKIVPKGTHTYEKFIRPSELEASLSRHNFKLLSLKGIAYNPFSRKTKLVDHIDVNYIFLAKKI
jgi:2-polyprenyl-6-hydroxyphenyl methylase / 3-demethylubiquinone-9 3-methyltransferase